MKKRWIFTALLLVTVASMLFGCGAPAAQPTAAPARRQLRRPQATTAPARQPRPPRRPRLPARLASCCRPRMSRAGCRTRPASRMPSRRPATSADPVQPGRLRQGKGQRRSADQPGHQSAHHLPAGRHGRRRGGRRSPRRRRQGHLLRPPDPRHRCGRLLRDLRQRGGRRSLGRST